MPRHDGASGKKRHSGLGTIPRSGGSDFAPKRDIPDVVIIGRAAGRKWQTRVPDGATVIDHRPPPPGPRASDAQLKRLARMFNG